MTLPRTFVIVGAGLAGATAAQTLREEGFEGRVVLLGAEDERPYERPPLSKEVLRGQRDDAGAYVHEERFYDDHAIELRTATTAQSLDVGGAAVVLASGERVRYDRLLLATGAQPRRLTVPGGDLRGVHELRTLSDCAALRERLRPGARMVVAGAGWIGCEVAASARRMGLDVTVIEPTSAPLERALGREVGAIYRDLHAAHGVRMLLGRRVAAFEGRGAVSAVCTADGERIACDVCVAGVGVVARSALAERAGIEVANGIVVDDQLQTNAPGVFAAGDVARAWHPLYDRAIRVEHWSNALHQSAAAARNMLGAGDAYDRIPTFFSDQYDVAMEYFGQLTRWDELVIRGDAPSGAFVAFWLRGGLVLAAMSANVPDAAGDIPALIGSGEPIDGRLLADAAVPLAKLLLAPLSAQGEPRARGLRAIAGGVGGDEP